MQSRSARSSSKRRQISVEIFCAACGYTKHFSQFSKGKSKFDRQHWCKSCRNLYNAGYYRIGKDAALAQKDLEQTERLVDGLAMQRETELFLPEVPKPRAATKWASAEECELRELEKRAAKLFVMPHPFAKCYEK